MKKIYLITLMLSITFILSGCKSDNLEIPLFLYNEEDPYIKEFKTHILNESSGLHDIVSYDAQNSQLLQNEMIELVLEKNPKVLIVNPVDRLGAYTLIDKAKMYDIPIVFINREPLKTDMMSWNKVYYIGAPAKHSAELQTEMIIDIFGNPNELSQMDTNGDNIIQLVLLKGELGHQDAEIRSDVVIQELEDYGYDIEIVSIEPCEWKTEIAYTKMNLLLARLTGSIELVISNNDAMAIGAIDSLVEYGYFIDTNEDGVIDRETETWIPVIGIDGIAEANNYIDSGLLYGTVINDSEKMSEVLIELLNLLISEGNLDNLSVKLEDEKYIWIDYKKYESNKD